MAIRYVDLVNGNDSNNGVTFATRKKTLLSAWGSLSGENENIPDGHEIRVMGQDITEVGTATFYTHQQRQKPFSGISAITTGSNPTVTYNNHSFSEDNWVWMYATQTANRDVAGIWQIKNVTTNSFDLIGVNNTQAALSTTSGSIYSISRNIIYLDSAVTKTLVSTRRNSSYDITYGDQWIASTGVTHSYNTGGFSVSSIFADKFTIGSTVAAGKLAYHTFSSTLDLSDYQQLSFLMYQNSGVTSGTTYYYSICLCSDTTGDTVVNEFIIPSRGGAGKYNTFAIDYGSSLGSSIQSIAIYKYGPTNSADFYLSNIIACKAPSEPDSLTLRSLIGVGNGNWYNILSIDERRVTIAHYLQSGSSVSVWTGHGENIDGTATVYKIEPNYETISNNFTNYSDWYSVNVSSENSYVKISGGWNTTDMSTQDSGGMTFIGSLDNNGRFAYGGTASHLHFENIGVVNFYTGFYISSSSCKGWRFTNCTFIGVQDYSINYPTLGEHYETYDCKFIANNGTGVNYQRNSRCANYNTFSAGSNHGNLSAGVLNIYQSNDILVEGLRSISTKQSPIYSQYSLGVQITDYNVMHYCTGHANNFRGISIQNSANVSIKGGIMTTRDSGSISASACYNVSADRITINNTSGSSLQGDVSVGANQGSRSLIGLTNFSHNSVVGIQSVYIACTASVIESDGFTSTGSGFSYRTRLTTTNRSTEKHPQEFPLAQVLVSSGSTVSVAASVYRTGAGLNYKLFCPSGQMIGLGATEAKATTTSQWERLSFDFVPTETGVIEIFAGVWGATTSQYTYIDNLEVSQE